MRWWGEEDRRKERKKENELKISAQYYNLSLAVKKENEVKI